MTASSIRISDEITSPVSSASATGASEDRATQSAADADLWIFRDGRREVSGSGMVRELSRRIAGDGQWIDCLIEAGELEAALADADSPSANAVSQLTDALAHRVCTGNPPAGIDLQQLLGRVIPPEKISISPPEGFTYYALHPLDFARIVERLPAEPRACAIVGIRSIGTTLSAMTTAALRAEGRSASRITVRPTGHPYSRSTQFTAEQLRWIRQHLAPDAKFLIVDEGPGRSGSTFLSVAEALVDAGVKRERITVLGSRKFDPEILCAEDAGKRWRSFRFIPTIPSVNTRFEGHIYIGGGDWRHYSEDTWPESWTQMERLKFLSPDGETFFKFEGVGPRGHDVRERAVTLASAGFSPSVSDAGDGFLAYARVHGRHLQPSDFTSSLLEHIARYCAFRISEFRCPQSYLPQLRQMTELNVKKEFGFELPKSNIDLSGLESSIAVLADGRMQPHEWMRTDSGDSLKTDTISHGDDHFFPGPCDIAWDLAGAAIEWRMDSEGIKFMLARFRQYSGVDVSRRLPAHLLAYSVFRLGFCKMAATTVPGTPEEIRLRSAQKYYRSCAEQMLASRD